MIMRTELNRVAEGAGDCARRDFLKTMAVGAVLGSGAIARAAEQRVPVVDAHVHCFAGGSDARFPYHPQGPYRPEKASPPELLLQRMDGAGVDFAVIVHPEPYQDDHRFLERCFEVGGKRLKGTCLFFAGRPGSIPAMQALVKRNPGRVVAARIHAYQADRLPPFGKPELRELWRAAAELGLGVQLHFEPRFGIGFEPLIKEFAQTTVVIDHLGRPFQGTREDHAAIVRWARFPNTVMKISSLPTPEEQPLEKVTAVIRELAGAFGAGRMIYGGGFDENATAESYRAYRERTRGMLVGMSAADQAKVLGGTAARVFGFGAA